MDASDNENKDAAPASTCIFPGTLYLMGAALL